MNRQLLALTEKYEVPPAVLATDLRATAGVLRAEGWCRDTFCDPTDGRLCLVGAIRKAIAGEPDRHPRDIVLAGRAYVAEAALTLHVTEAGAVVEDEGVVAWNDTVCRSADEAVALVERVAAGIESEATP